MKIKTVAVLFLTATAMAASAWAGETERIFHAFQPEAGGGQTADGDNVIDWDFDGWVGGDENKLSIKSEGERVAGKTEQAEFQAVYSRNISTFWDAQIGVRHDTRPDSITYFVLGFEGLMPHFFETEAHVFVSREGTGFRLSSEKDLLVSQRLILQPYIKTNLYAQDIPEIGVGSGLSDMETGIQARYEFTRKFAPFIDVKYERKFGKTSSGARRKGEKTDAVVGTTGLRLLF